VSDHVRFQGDANFNNWIIKGLLRRLPAIAIQTAEAAHLHGMPDLEVLEQAAADGRILLTHDYHTMPEHFGAFLASGHHCPSVILLHQTLPIAQAIDALELVWEASSLDEWRDTLTYLP